MSPNDLKTVLEQHKLWLEGKQANLSGAILPNSQQFENFLKGSYV